MSEENEQDDEETEWDEASDEEEEELEEGPQKILKKRKGKTTIISDTEEKFESADEDKLIFEITNLLKKARVAMAEKDYITAVKSYQDASIAAGMIGDTDREKTYITRANEILQEHPELKEEGFKILKKRKLKSRIREEEEKFSIIRLISHVIIAGIILGFALSGLLSAVVLQELLEVSSSYNKTLVWAVCIVIQIAGLVIAYYIGKRWLSWSA